jgi:hypothetical protein
MSDVFMPASYHTTMFWQRMNVDAYRSTGGELTWPARMQFSSAQQALINEVVAGPAAIPGMVAIVLGGSHAGNRARPDSNIDLGLIDRAVQWRRDGGRTRART